MHRSLLPRHAPRAEGPGRGVRGAGFPLGGDPGRHAVVALPQPTNLSDGQLRALDALSAARRAGYVTEAEYRRRYLLVLENRLSDAGYSPATP